MSIKILDTDGVSSIHTAERLEIDLIIAAEVVEKMKLKIYFNIETQLPSGRLVGQPYFDRNNPLILDCENDLELAEAMRVIQRKIGQARYAQMTAPVPAPVESPGLMQSEQI